MVFFRALSLHGYLHISAMFNAVPVGADLPERRTATIGREAAIKPVLSVCQKDLELRFYDGFAADRG